MLIHVSPCDKQQLTWSRHSKGSSTRRPSSCSWSRAFTSSRAEDGKIDPGCVRGKFAKQRLKALARVEAPSSDQSPAVLFLCVRNAGRSQWLPGWFTSLAGDRAIGWSGGSEPGAAVNPAAVAAMAEVGIDISQEFPKPWTDEFVQAADVVVSMGCGDACPIFPGKRYEDWVLEDPAGMRCQKFVPFAMPSVDMSETCCCG